MIPNHLSLVPLDHKRRAAMQAIAEVEEKYRRGIRIAEFAYASAFFRILNGSRRITIDDIRFFSTGLTLQSLRGKKRDWLTAINQLIASRGKDCWLPLSLYDCWQLFPEMKFQMSERLHRSSELKAEKNTRQYHRKLCQRQIAYQALVRQAETELAFHTPETIRSWYACWSEKELHQYDIEAIFWRWRKRFPSLKSLKYWMMEGYSFRDVIDECDALLKESHESVRQWDRWMIPNKLPDRSRS